MWGAKASAFQSRALSIAKGSWAAATPAQLAPPTGGPRRTLGTPALDPGTGVTVNNYYRMVSGSMDPRVYRKAEITRDGKTEVLRFPSVQGWYLGAFPATGRGVFWNAQGPSIKPTHAQAYLLDLATTKLCRTSVKPYTPIDYPIPVDRWIVAVRPLMTEVPLQNCQGERCAPPLPEKIGEVLVVLTDLAAP